MLHGNEKELELTIVGRIPAQHNSFSHESRHDTETVKTRV